ncbi:hypothetical protein [Jiangella asiatica]|uniref:Uncharacterized protein n=1 Tax=Jiangella asiatica TaxID=2530372 RepID=A0A4R5DGH8_9ACTN|nr:hypothetical protein [Jiangella asiatica]TDE13096.1 hypothetical protein E1269_06815 [Jiangella asiatica]
MAIVAGVSAVIAHYWGDGPWWLLIALCCVAGIGTPAVWWLRQQAVRWDRQDHALESTIRSALDDSVLQHVGDAGLEVFGVHRAHLHVPYLVRDAHADVLAAVEVGEPVLVLGHPMAGKSRLGAEVVRRRFADRPLVVPTPPRGLAQLFGAGASPVDTVVWLDDLERYLPREHFRVEWLDRAVRARNIVVATMRAAPYETYLPTRDVRRSQWEILERFQPVWLHSDEQERARLAAMASDPRTRAGILRYGLGEYFGGGMVAVERLHAGESRHQLAVAMVRAASDWRRAGLDAIPEPVLCALALHYLPQSALPVAPETMGDALDWAGEMIDQSVALLEPTPTGWRAFDFVVDDLHAHGRPIPEATWDAVLRSAGDRLMSVSYAAAVVHRRHDVAERAWRLAHERRTGADGPWPLDAGRLPERYGPEPGAAWCHGPPPIPTWPWL